MKPERSKLKKTSLNLDPETYRQARIRALEEGKRVGDVVEEALRAYLAKKGRHHGSR